MKKEFLTRLTAGFFALAVTIFAVSCDEDEPIPDGPTVGSTTASAQIGASATLSFTVTSPGGYKSVAIGSVTNGAAVVATEPTVGAETGTITVTFTAGNTQGSGIVPITVTDNNNKTATAQGTVTISLLAPPTISLSASAGNGLPGGTIAVTATVAAANGGSAVTITGATSTPASPFAFTTTSLTQEFSLAIPANAVVGSVINVSFVVEDAQDLLSTPATFAITVTDPTVILEGNITTNTTLQSNTKYLLRGKVYVQSGITLTIQPGTIIFGEKDSDGTLIINRGATIDAKGTATNPIIMTSQAPKGFRNRGDWGGVVILGKAYNSNGASATIEGITAAVGSENGVYGPGASADAVDADNSGFLQYTRIEFAGIALSTDNELNSLTMGSVGSGTTIDHILVSYGNDDAYEWFGGSVNHKYLIAYSTIDDDFDTDRGYNGKVQYGVVIRDPQVADFSGSRAWESSSNNSNPAPTVGGVSRQSAPTFSHVTVWGPNLFRAPASVNGFYRAAVEINSNSNIKIHNSIITGFVNAAVFGSAGSTVSGNVFSANTTQTATGASAPATFATDNVLEGTITNIFGAFPSGSLYSFATPPVYQSATSPYLTGATDLSADAFFTNTAHRGAFAADAATSPAGWNFTSAWVNLDPNNANY